MAVMLIHVWWVLRSDAAFEDAAIDASAARAKKVEAMRNRRSAAAVGAPRPATSTLRLASHGHPALAIIFTILRSVTSVSPGHADVFRSQQYGPLLEVAIPME